MTKTILILSANPRKDLDLKYEIHTLKGVIERSQEGEQFEIKIGSAVRPQDLQDLFHRYEPWLVHFCGHGTGEQGLVLEDDKGKERLVSTSAISNLFKNFSDKIECALLNACYSERQADAIVQHINYAIGIRQEIRDDTAIVFARGFYQALGYGKSISEAFNLGCNAIEINSYNSDLNIPQSKILKQDRKLIPVSESPEIIPPEHMKPQLKIKSSLTFYSSEDLPVNSELYRTLIKTTQEEIARERYREDCQDDFGLGQFSLQRRQPLNQQEYRWKKVLLNKVKDSWIKGVLENSLHSKILFELDIRERRDAIERPFSNLEEFSQDSDKSFEWLQASDFFEEMGMGKTLLILGEPGTGKTISLLKLAERLIKRTEQDLSLSIPVVFNLSSWGIKRQAIADWLVTELRDKYQVSSSLGKQWIQEEELILLLDGLDEVQAEYRNDCVRALNEFIETYGVTEIVMCSRVRDYEALSERLKLRSAICIQKLSSEYIDWYLEDIGKPLEGLKVLLERDRDLAEFAQTPLIFSIMILTYDSCKPEEILQQVVTRSQRHKSLFDNYIDRMFSRRKSIKKLYEKRISKYWIGFLSKQIRYSSQSVFLIEHIDNKWLKDKKQRWLYSSGVWIIVWIFVTFFVLLISFIFILLTSSPPSLIVEASRYIIFFMFCCGLILIPIFGTVFPMFNEVVKPVEIINWSSFNLIDLCSLSFWLYVGIVCTIPVIASGRFTTIFLIPAFNRIERLSRNLLYGKSLQTTQVPNQGIWNSIDNIRIFMLLEIFIISIIVAMLSLGLMVQESTGWLLYIWIICLFVLPILCAFLFIMFAGTASSAFAVSKHFLLRLILWSQGYIPWNYARFLDYSTEILFMQKLGGGYIFVHRMLMEHFAQMKEEEMRS